MEKVCPKCGNKASDCKSLFCDKCGSKLPERAVCEKCGKPAPSCKSLFCDSCGTPFPVPEPHHGGKICPACGNVATAPQSAFCDICGSRLSTVAPGAASGAPVPDARIVQAEKNSELSVLILRLAFIFGIISIFINPLSVIVIIIVSAYAVYNDANEIQAGSRFTKVEPTKTFTWRPKDWALMVLIVWIVGLPLYLIKREQSFGLFTGAIRPESLWVPTPGPAMEPSPQPVVDHVMGPVPGQAPQPSGEIIPEQAQQPVTGPTPETTTGPTREAVPESTEKSPGLSLDVGEKTPETGAGEPVAGTAAPGEPVREPQTLGDISGIITGIPEMGVEPQPSREETSIEKTLPGSRKKLAIIAGVIIIAVLIIAVFLSGMAPGGGAGPLPAISIPTIPTESPLHEYAVGDSATDANQKLTVNSYVIKDKIGSITPASLDKEKAGYKFLIVDLTVGNLQQDRVLDTNDFALINKDGYLFTTENVSALDNRFNGIEIPAKEERRGNLAFSVPANATGLKFKYNLDSDVVALFKLN